MLKQKTLYREKLLMNDDKTIVERRRYKRFEVQESKHILIDSDFLLVGQVKNISPNGLSFQYVADGKKINELFKDSFFDIDLFCSIKKFYLTKLPFRSVSDFVVENNIPFSSIIMRQCCGEFGELSKFQASQVDAFIRNYATDNTGRV